MPSQPKYLSSTAVVLAEVTKIAASFGVLFYQHRGDAFGYVWQGVIAGWRDTLLVGVPALLLLRLLCSCFLVAAAEEHDWHDNNQSQGPEGNDEKHPRAARPHHIVLMGACAAVTAAGVVHHRREN